MTPEDQAAYHQHCQSTKRALAPEGAFEAGLVQSIADDRWRLFRAASLDINTCAVSISEPDKIITGHPQVQTAFAQAVAWAADSKNMNLLSLYEGRIQRRVEKNVKLLRESQAQRKAALLAQAGRCYAYWRETYDVEREFPRAALPPQFDFSLSEIARLAAHHRGRADAKRRLQSIARFLIAELPERF